MSTVRVAKRAKFTSVDRRTINDRGLSFKARGVLVWLLDKPDDWRVTVEGIEAGSDRDGRAAVRSALTELEEAGYLVRRRYRGPNGQWFNEHVLYERPKPEPATAENRTASLLDDDPSTTAENRLWTTAENRPRHQVRKTDGGKPDFLTKTEDQLLIPPNPQPVPSSSTAGSASDAGSLSAPIGHREAIADAKRALAATPSRDAARCASSASITACGAPAASVSTLTEGA